MSNLSKLEFVALDISKKNYQLWFLDAEIHLAAKGLGNTITHVKVPLDLWTGLKERYDHLKATVLPRARYEWMHLRLQDFKTQQYHERGFKKYPELISCLLVAEQHNTLLLKNHEARSTGSAPLPEANMAARRSSNKNDDNAEANLALNDDDFQGLDDLTHLEVEDFSGDQN
uniref:Uncharacterized protein n=1 Tax=Nicotiana tabacum TaxID=4097 RepID=A0A1S4DRW6_TOBAC|nr:PREDICTED: uncharacterized protein LOC107832804 [Nicotiana tabacum]